MKARSLTQMTSWFIVLGLATMASNASASRIVIDASGPEPSIAFSDDPFFFDPSKGMVSLWGPSTITPIGPSAWELKLIFAGSDYASFGSANRGLELTAPITGELLDSISFNYFIRDTSFFLNTDLVMFDAYLYTADAYGNPSGRSARCPQGLCMTFVYDGSDQLVMQDMSTAYTTFDVYLKGTAPNDSNNPAVPEPETTSLLAVGLTVLLACRRTRSWPRHPRNAERTYKITPHWRAWS